MKTIRQAIKEIMPRSMAAIADEHYVRARWEVNWYSNPKRHTSAQRLRLLKNKHAAKRCFIIGNGPSLRNTDLSLLRNEVTFGLNRIYLLFNTLGFHTSYYVSVNRLVIQQCAHEIELLPMPKFVGWHARDSIRFTPDMIFVRNTWSDSLGFSLDPTHHIWEGATVTYVAMQLAYYMGFRQVILIGVDHSFASQGPPHMEITATGVDNDHFDPNYFGPGFRWQLPDLQTSEEAYQLAKRYFERDGREILDATIDGKLQVFPKVGYERLF